MPLNRASETIITCGAPADAARLTSLLSVASAWPAATAPDQVACNGSQVECTWYTNNAVPPSSPAAAIAMVKGTAGITAVTVTHVTTSNGGGKTTSKQ